MSTIRIGIIGTGMIAKTHAGILQNNSELVLGSVYDFRKDSSETFAADFGMQVLSSDKKVIENSDAVYVTVPNKFHTELTLNVVDRGKHIFCEKPFALNPSGVKEIVESVKKSGVIYHLGFTRMLASIYKKNEEFNYNQSTHPEIF